MKKLLLCGTAVAAALVASPANAQLELGIEGYNRTYGVYSNDEDNANSRREMNLRQDTELHFTGETVLDNGLTVGVHAEYDVGQDGAADTNDEIYTYFQGSWGRVNAGQEDGAAYLLQVTAPSADSNVDGARVYINGIQTNIDMEYDHADFGSEVQRLTYMTPKFNGFQAGLSYAFEDTENALGGGVGVMDIDDNGAGGIGGGEFEDLFELAARWDGSFENVGVSFGAGYSHASDEDTTAGLDDDLETWNVGATAMMQAFSFGASYYESNNGNASNGDTTTWVLGAGWNNGPYNLGVSYYDREDEVGAGQEVESDRLTLGGGYEFGPGMSFRGAVAMGEATRAGVAGDEEDFSQITVGTDISF